MKQLIITDAQKVAVAIAGALGLSSPGADWTEGEEYAVAWFGRDLFEWTEAARTELVLAMQQGQALPEPAEESGCRLRGDSLPRFRVLVLLMDRPDVAGIVNACQGGEAGELRFRLLYRWAGCRKPVTRLWLTGKWGR